MARRKKPPKPRPARGCECAERRRRGPVPVLASAPGSNDGCRSLGNEVFCVCRVCGSRWRVLVQIEYDGGFPDTTHVWEETPWTEEMLAAREAEARAETLVEAARERERAEAAEWQRQHDPNAGPPPPVAVPRRARAKASEPPSSTAVGTDEWSWTDERGVRYGCRIEGDRIAVWTDDPFGGSGTDFGVTEFLDGGAWRPRASVPTLDSAMDVGNPSNMERLRTLFPDRLTTRVSARLVTDEQIRATIRQDAEALDYVWDPHGATAAHVYHHALTDRASTKDDAWVLLATAHPAKFNEIVEPLIGRDIEVPPALARLLRLPRQEERLAPTVDALRARL